MRRWIAAIGTALLATLTLSVVGVSPASANTPAGPQYKFLQTERDGSAVAWACGTQQVKLYKPPTPGHAKVVESALARLNKITSTDFVLAGETTTSPNRTTGSSPAIIVGFDKLDPKWAGWTKRERLGDRWTRSYVTLNTAVAYIGAPATTSDWDRLRNTVLHELGHLAGLDHVEAASEVMFGKWNTGKVAWGSGDQTGLGKLGCEKATTKAKGAPVVTGDGLPASTGPSFGSIAEVLRSIALLTSH